MFYWLGYRELEQTLESAFCAFHSYEQNCFSHVYHLNLCGRDKGIKIYCKTSQVKYWGTMLKFFVSMSWQCVPECAAAEQSQYICPPLFSNWCCVDVSVMSLAKAHRDSSKKEQNVRILACFSTGVQHHTALIGQLLLMNFEAGRTEINFNFRNFCQIANG